MQVTAPVMRSHLLLGKAVVPVQHTTASTPSNAAGRLLASLRSANAGLSPSAAPNNCCSLSALRLSALTL
jgi:hypothetical protein